MSSATGAEAGVPAGVAATTRHEVTARSTLSITERGLRRAAALAQMRDREDWVDIALFRIGGVSESRRVQRDIGVLVTPIVLQFLVRR